MRLFRKRVPDENIPTYRGIGMPLIKGTINITSPEQAKRVIKMVRGEIPIPRAETE